MSDAVIAFINQGSAIFILFLTIMALWFGIRLANTVIQALGRDIRRNAYDEKKAHLRSKLSAVSSDDLEAELMERQARRLGIEKSKSDEKPKRGRVYIGDDGELLEEMEE
jgi:hypothetical protein